MKRKFWTEEEKDFLRKHYPTKSADWCAEQLGRAVTATEKMTAKLGIKKEWKYFYVDEKGYMVIRPNRQTKIYEHRLVMEEHLGRKLTSQEIVHHKDGNKLNNDISNLEIMTRAEHVNEHRQELLEARESKRKR